MAINSIQPGLNQSILQQTFAQNKPSLTANSINLAQQNQAQTKEELLAGVASQQIGLTGNLLSGIGKGDPLTDKLVSFSVQANTALANSKLPTDIGNVVGRIINETV
ncbi:hypothetical protein ACMZOO_13445 [Catenovulum sp. SX2]|uniref:hypothetical protein n=1 Tax=Catenovulum sp. SX2 TaxID=3398614 RepID=UPI003F852B68